MEIKTAQRNGEMDGSVAYLLKRDDVRGDFIKRSLLPESVWPAYRAAWEKAFCKTKSAYTGKAPR